MEEPSVLDYVKAKLTFWKKTDLHLSPSGEEPDPGEMDAAVFAELAVQPPAVPLRETAARAFAGFPWLMTLAVVLALAAQLALEPPGRNWQAAVVLYIFCALCLGVGAWRGLFQIAAPRSEPIPGTRPADRALTAWTVIGVGLTLAVCLFFVRVDLRAEGLALAALRGLLIVLALLAGLGATVWNLFLSADMVIGRKNTRLIMLVILAVGLVLLIVGTYAAFAGAKFTATNLTLWFLLILFTLIAMARTDPRDWPARIKAFLARPHWLRVDWFVVLLIVVIAVTAFFRFYNLSGLPGEMFSDHAEKLYDVNDVMNGHFNTYFIRNTGREFFQFYWTALMAIVFQTGISFMSLKIGTVLTGLVTLYFIFRLGNEVGGKWVGLYALFFAAVAYWPNIISRIGLRFPLYPFCVAPVLFYIMRGLRREERNDFIWAGLWLGLGLHGYTASRIVPLAVLVIFAIYLLHRQSRGKRGEALVWLGVVTFVTFVVFIPLFRYALDNPEMFYYRTLTRVSDLEQPLPGAPLALFLSNLWRGLTMFFWDNGNIWVHSIPGRPALAVVDAALFFLGFVLLAVRYVKKPHWRDLALLVSVPVLLLPSVLSLAFPNENPNLNRTAGAYVVVFVILGLGLDALLRAFRDQLGGARGQITAAGLGLALALLSLGANYNLFFKQYAQVFNRNAWNSSEMGEILRGFSQVVGTSKTAWVVGYPYWVDTRLVGINAGTVDTNPETSLATIEKTFDSPLPKLYLLNVADVETLDTLQVRFPAGSFWLHRSAAEGKDFIVFMVPADAEELP